MNTTRMKSTALMTVGALALTAIAPTSSPLPLPIAHAQQEPEASLDRHDSRWTTPPGTNVQLSKVKELTAYVNSTDPEPSWDPYDLSNKGFDQLIADIVEDGYLPDGVNSADVQALIIAHTHISEKKIKKLTEKHHTRYVCEKTSGWFGDSFEAPDPIDLSCGSNYTLRKEVDHYWVSMGIPFTSAFIKLSDEQKRWTAERIGNADGRHFSAHLGPKEWLREKVAKEKEAEKKESERRAAEAKEEAILAAKRAEKEKAEKEKEEKKERRESFSGQTRALSASLNNKSDEEIKKTAEEEGSALTPDSVKAIIALLGLFAALAAAVSQFRAHTIPALLPPPAPGK